LLFAMAAPQLACSRDSASDTAKTKGSSKGGGDDDESAPSKSKKQKKLSNDDDEAKPKKKKSKKAADDDAPKKKERDPCDDADAPTWKVVKAVGKAPTLDVSYPEFTSSCTEVAESLSAVFSKDAKRRRAAFEKDYADAKRDGSTFLDGFDYKFECIPTFVSARVVSVLCGETAYTGGAHGGSSREGHTFVIEGTKLREVKLAELFDGTKAWKSKVARLANGQVTKQRKQRELDPVEDSKVEGALGPFALIKMGVVVYFDSYTLGPYAEGSFDATLSFDSLSGLLADDGPVSKM